MGSKEKFNFKRTRCLGIGSEKLNSKRPTAGGEAVIGIHWA